MQGALGLIPGKGTKSQILLSKKKNIYIYIYMYVCIYMKYKLILLQREICQSIFAVEDLKASLRLAVGKTDFKR